MKGITEQAKRRGNRVRLERLVRRKEPTEVTKKEWIDRCADRYRERAGMDPHLAYAAAKVCWEENEDGEDPEYMADEDMACWDDDA